MDSPNEGQRKTRLAAALLVAGTLLLYLPVVHHNFIPLWDDDAYVTENPHVRSGLSLSNVTWALTSFEQSNWHPVTWWSHMLDCQLFGLNPAPQHYVNVLLHASNVLLLFWILQRATRAVGKSFVVAALFAVHPLNVEAVAWIAQRKSVLSAFFSLLAVAAYGWYARSGGWKKYLVLVGAFALALMAKPMAVTLPVLLLLFDYWPLQRLEQLPFGSRWFKLTVEKLPLLAMSTASSVLTEMAQGAGGSVMGLSLLPVSIRIENALISCGAYIGKTLWPVRLATYYPLRFSPPLGDAVASAAILIAITALVLYCRRQRYLAVGWFFFLLALVPIIGIVQVGFQGMADRYMYVPAIGLFMAVVWGGGEIVERLATSKAVPAFVALCAIGGYGIATVHYLRYWQNGVTLFAQAEAAWGQPDMWLEQLYGNALFSAGRIDEALQHYEQSCAIQPRTEYCHYNIAHILSGRGQFWQALDEYQLALKYTANRNMALLCLTESAEAQMKVGAYDAAQESVAKALLINPADPSVLRLRQEIVVHRGVN
jgi:tetratricopeptide (TPR) repeat protein